MDNNIGSNRIGRAYFALCKSSDTPVSLGCWLRYKHAEFAQLASMEIDARNYTCAYDFDKDYTVVSYLAKYKGFDFDVDTKAEALQRFNAAEAQCAKTNERIYTRSVGSVDSTVGAVISIAQRKIAACLGKLTCQALEMCRWGPGATTTVRGRYVLADKIGEYPICVSSSARPYLRMVLDEDYHLYNACGGDADGPCSFVDSAFRVIRGSRITTVPKNALTDRTIGIEPTGNIFLQLGVGSLIRRKLRAVGVDLNDQTVNQNLAKQGSIDGKTATVDLSSASDTIACATVLDLLPLEWVDYLDKLRSKHYCLEGVWHEYEKFSAMGNGFTFELESLIFWGLTSAISEYNESEFRPNVYGDDIVIAVRDIPLLRAVFEYYGFTLNDRKSHWDSQFRESCGKHWYAGVDVSPIYQKEVPYGYPEVLRACNRLRRLALRRGEGDFCDARFRSAWLALRHGLSVEHYVPLRGESEEGLAVPLTEVPARRKKSVVGGVLLPTLHFAVKKLRKDQRKTKAGLAYWFRFRKGNVLQTNVCSLRSAGRYKTKVRYFAVGTANADWLDLS